MYRTITLSNGARLLTEYIPGARSAALGFFVGAGSRHERATENGAAHFIEHLSFKGTDRRSAADLAREIDAIGGQVNAYTTKESTCYYARCLDRHLDRASDLLCDMLFHSRFAQEDVELERSVILEEIGMYEDAPEDLCADRLSMAVYKGRPILGRSSTLNEMTGESLRQWQAEHYCPGSIVVALAGRFEERHITALRDKLIDGLAAIPHAALNGDRDHRLPGNVNVCFEGIEGESLLLLLDDRGICASSGSACTSGSLDPSHVLLAIGRPHEVAHGSLRLSLCEEKAEVDTMLREIPKVVEYLCNMSPVWRELQKGARDYVIQ